MYAEGEMRYQFFEFSENFSQQAGKPGERLWPLRLPARLCIVRPFRGTSAL
jgi:hypothetical protein